MTPAATFVRERLAGRTPRIALILGSGLGALAGEALEPIRIPYAMIPGFPESGVSGHAGELVCGRLAGVEVLILSGRIHYYEHGDPAAMKPVIEALADLGVESLVLTNSAGSLREDLAPGSVMLIEDHINFLGLSPLIGESGDKRFVDMTAAYDPELRKAMLAAAERAGVALGRGVYMFFAGPSFETPAEIRMARVMGADAVGMSTVPEAILARYFGLRLAGCSIMTNYAAGMTEAGLSHEETKAMAPKGGETLAKILKAALPEF
ncbi:purine-nucleoside phosphorylase [Mangrovibrevibacter kandeliae]|uniref:purine-nucleoside phosphorylase n=1 Tax=Mangrovibrevibacter kandeliae TaxID=2968473 RepID=UPI002118E773|nr:purine-nucleoside phosphorylase [Aurantimonas sp. CSK15Z-1]